MYEKDLVLIEDIRGMLRELRRLTYKVRRLGLLVLMVTLADIFTLIAGVAATIISLINYRNNNYTGSPYGQSPYWLIGNAAVFVASIVILGYFDQTRKRGDGLYQEVSNELQIVESSDKDERVPADLAREARLDLRSFASAADLPLVPGRIGTPVYSLLNVAIIVISVILFSQFS